MAFRTYPVLRRTNMQWEVSLNKNGSVMRIVVHGNKPDQAWRAAQAQNPGYRATAVRRV